MLLKMFSREWLLTTILVVIGSGVCVRLGIWQLDRLEQRKEFNAQFEQMRAAAPLELNNNSTNSDFTSMEWRKVEVTGEYDFENQIAIRNQYHNSGIGYHLVTPVLFDGKAVLVDRGWIPADGNSEPDDWRKYDEPGMVNVKGQIRLGYVKPAIGGVEEPVPVNADKILLWNNLDLDKISEQMPYPILDIYIQPDVTKDDDTLPIPYQPVIEISGGPHVGYALQWFTFASILFFGYPFYLRKQSKI